MNAKSTVPRTPTSEADPAATHIPRDDVFARGFDAVNGALVAAPERERWSSWVGGLLAAGTVSGSLVGDTDAPRRMLNPAAFASASVSSSALWKRRAGSFSS